MEKLKGKVLLGKQYGAGDVVVDGVVVRRAAGARVVTAGDADTTLGLAGGSTSAGDGTILLYGTPLTAPRTVTLPTGVPAKAAGIQITVTRQAAATGASGLDVGGLKTLAVGQWCIVGHNGSAWVLLAFGSL